MELPRIGGNVVHVLVSDKSVSALIIVGEASMDAGSSLSDDGVRTSKPWHRTGSTGLTWTVAPKVHSLANGTAFEGLDSSATGEITVSRELDAEGGSWWLMSIPWGGRGALDQAWLIDASGYLRAWSNEHVDGRVEIQLNPLASPDPIVLPEAGSELDLASLGFPMDLLAPSP